MLFCVKCCKMSDKYYKKELIPLNELCYSNFVVEEMGRENMITNKYADKKYVILISAVFFVSIICSTIIEPNIVDITYLILSSIIAIRYLILCINN